MEGQATMARRSYRTRHNRCDGDADTSKRRRAARAVRIRHGLGAHSASPEVQEALGLRRMGLRTSEPRGRRRGPRTIRPLTRCYYHVSFAPGQGVSLSDQLPNTSCFCLGWTGAGKGNLSAPSVRYHRTRVQGRLAVRDVPPFYPEVDVEHDHRRLPSRRAPSPELPFADSFRSPPDGRHLSSRRREDAG